MTVKEVLRLALIGFLVIITFPFFLAGAMMCSEDLK